MLSLFAMRPCDLSMSTLLPKKLNTINALNDSKSHNKNNMLNCLAPFNKHKLYFSKNQNLCLAKTKEYFT